MFPFCLDYICNHSSQFDILTLNGPSATPCRTTTDNKVVKVEHGDYQYERGV